MDNPQTEQGSRRAERAGARPGRSRRWARWVTAVGSVAIFTGILGVLGRPQAAPEGAGAAAAADGRTDGANRSAWDADRRVAWDRPWGGAGRGEEWDGWDDGREEWDEDWEDEQWGDGGRFLGPILGGGPVDARTRRS